jgi:ApaG protein
MANPEFRCLVQPEFMPDASDPAQPLYAFKYTVTVRNTGDVAAQLIGRHWVITDATGHTEEVRGLAVVGHQPLLQPGEEFRYESWTRLATPQGHMRGTYFCMSVDCEPFEADVPAFLLSQGQALH